VRQDALYGWYASSYDAAKASTRLRLLNPMTALNARGIAAERFEARHLSRYSVIVLSKTFSVAAAKLARSAQAMDIPIIADICDNVFELACRRGKFRKHARIHEQLDRACLISVATPVLGDLVRAANPAWGDKIRVVPDALEDLPDGGLSWFDRYHLRRVQAFLHAYPERLHCIWFGRSSDDVSGLAHLSGKLREIGCLADRPITITVISNDHRKYRTLSQEWTVPHHYLPWTLNSFAPALRLHQVGLVPVRPNSFTIAKTLNRPATAIGCGLGVIADSIDSYEELEPYVFLDDWREGLDQYARNWGGECERLTRAQAYLDRHYGPAEISRRWGLVLAEAATGRRPAVGG
jgi:hypothetical protein